jgi:hypothetical protein
MCDGVSISTCLCWFSLRCRSYRWSGGSIFLLSRISQVHLFHEMITVVIIQFIVLDRSTMDHIMNIWIILANVYNMKLKLCTNIKQQFFFRVLLHFGGVGLPKPSRHSSGSCSVSCSRVCDPRNLVLCTLFVLFCVTFMSHHCLSVTRVSSIIVVTPYAVGSSHNIAVRKLLRDAVGRNVRFYCRLVTSFA